MNGKKFIASVLIFMFAIACKKESSNPDFDDKPVIESYLKVGDTARVTVSRLIAFASDATYSSDNMNALQVYISVNGASYQLQPVGDSGKYIAKNPVLKIKEGMTYNLSLQYNSKKVSATTVIPAKPKDYTQSVTTLTVAQITAGSMPNFSSTSSDPVTLTWTNTDNSYYLVVVQNVETNPTAVNTNTAVTSNAPKIFKNSPIQTNTYQIRPMQFSYYGKHLLILYHLNPDYAALYSDDSNNSNNLTNSSTSVVNGAGIFTGINADTLILYVKKS